MCLKIIVFMWLINSTLLNISGSLRSHSNFLILISVHMSIDPKWCILLIYIALGVSFIITHCFIWFWHVIYYDFGVTISDLLILLIGVGFSVSIIFLASILLRISWENSNFCSIRFIIYFVIFIYRSWCFTLPYSFILPLDY